MFNVAIKHVERNISMYTESNQIYMALSDSSPLTGASPVSVITVGARSPFQIGTQIILNFLSNNSCPKYASGGKN